MKSKISLQELLTSLLCFIPMIIGIIIYNDLPDTVPIHWNAVGEIDDYASKSIAVFGLPLFLFFIDLIVIIGINFDPKRSGQSKQMKRIAHLIVPMISLIIVPISYLIAMGKAIEMERVIMVIISIAFIIIGNNMPKNRQNYTMGFRLPWTLDDSENWYKTHRLASYVWVIAGALMLLTTFINLTVSVKMLLIVVFIIVAILCPMIYSFGLYYRKSH